MTEFALESSAFEHAQAIPNRHTCEGENLSPPLRWANAPEASQLTSLPSGDVPRRVRHRGLAHEYYRAAA